MSKLIERIAELNDGNNTVKIIRAHLVIEGYKDKEVNEALKEEGIVGTKVGFTANYFDWLAEDYRTEAEVKDYILNPDNSENTIKHLRVHTGVADLVRRVRDNERSD